MDSHKTEQVEKTATASSRQLCSPIVELRQYTLHPGLRDMLISLFERAFIETQEAMGITVIGQFRDLGDPNRFVWLRGFPDMDKRLAALQAFYGGPVWQAYRDVVKSGASILASFVTEASANTFPATPVREGEQVFVWFSGFLDQAAYDQHVAALARSQEWHDRFWEPLMRHLKAAPSVLKLTPTARSLVRG